MSDMDLERSRAAFGGMLDYGKSTIRYLFFLNGGAVVAVLAFLGSLAREGSIQGKAALFVDSIWAFVIGLAFCVIASACGYFNFQEAASSDRAGVLRLTQCFAIASVVGSGIAFLVGVWLTTLAMPAL